MVFVLSGTGQGGLWMTAGEHTDLLCSSAEVDTTQSVCTGRSAAGECDNKMSSPTLCSQREQ